MKIADLYAEVGFKFDTIKLHEVARLIGDLNIASIIGATSIAALGGTIAALIAQMKSVSDYSAKLLNVSQSTGINPTTIQQLDTYFQEYGAGAGSATAALQKLNDLRTKALMGDPGASSAFTFAGILPTTDDLSILDQLRQKMGDGDFLKRWGVLTHQGTENTNELRAAFEKFAITNFGINDDMLRGLHSTNEEWQKQFTLLTMNGDALAINADFTKKWTVFTNDLSVLWKDFITIFEPLLEVLMPVLDWAVRLLDILAKIILLVENLIGKIPFIKFLDNLTSSANGSVKFPDKLSSDNILNSPSNFNIPDQVSRGTNNVTVNMAPITVQSNDPQQFADWYNNHWKDYMIKTSSQFGSQT